jgi:hypothetical protein
MIRFDWRWFEPPDQRADDWPDLKSRCPPIRWPVAAAWLPGSVGADVTDPLLPGKIAAGAKTESAD